MQTETLEKSYALSRTAIKYIAVICMLIDHIGMLFLSETSALYTVCRVLGRITCPAMCLFIAEGFRHTSSKLNYLTRLFLFAIPSQIAYTFAKYGTVITYKLFTDYNVLFTLAISFVVLLVYENIDNYVAKWIVIACLVARTYFCDWGIFAPLFVLAFYILQSSKNKQAIAFSVIAAIAVAFSVIYCATAGAHWYGELWQLGLFLFVPLLYVYDGKRGGNRTFDKWFFYAFYPLHLALFGLIAISI